LEELRRLGIPKTNNSGLNSAMHPRSFLKNSFTKLMNTSAAPLYRIFKIKRRFLPDARIPILTYHKITDIDFGVDAFWNVPPSLFARHMACLAAEGFKVLALHELYDCISMKAEIPRDSVVLTFDDGYANVFRYAYPVLKEYGFPATIFLTGDYSGGKNLYWWDREVAERRPDLYEDVRVLNWDEIKEMQSSKLITFGSHSMSHQHLGQLPRPRIEYELRQSRAYLEKRLNQPVRFFAYPGGIRAYGDISEETDLLLVESGYQLACTSETGRNSLRDNLYALKRIGMGRNDSPSLFRAKLIGGYDWVKWPQRAFHGMFKNPW